VLGASSGAPIDEWNIAGLKLQPQVWVAALSTISNALLGYSFVEGIAVVFWRRASAGTSVGSLMLASTHRDAPHSVTTT
jgi:hypothetical protein